jgi:hypothetical protein
MNVSKAIWPFGRSSGAESKAEAPKTAAVLFPLTSTLSPRPPRRGRTFARALVIRPSLVVVCLRNQRQRSGNCNCNIRIFQGRGSAFPLLGERIPRKYSPLDPMNPVGLRCRATHFQMIRAARQRSPTGLMGRVRVWGIEANSNPRHRTIPGTVKLRESPCRAGGFPSRL